MHEPGSNMRFDVNGRIIETDEQGFLLNLERCELAGLSLPRPDTGQHAAGRPSHERPRVAGGLREHEPVSHFDGKHPADEQL